MAEARSTLVFLPATSKHGHCNITVMAAVQLLHHITHHHTTTVLRPFFRDHPGDPVPEENIWTLWCKGRLTRQTHRPSGWAPLHPDQPVPTSTILPIFFRGQMPFLPPNRQSTEGN